MNAWPFILAAYAVGILGIVSLLLWSFLSMRRAEAAIDALGREP